MEYREWRKIVFARDNWTCTSCGSSISGKLEAHHLRPFYIILAENNIKSLNEALLCKCLWDVTNGTTLCHDCHKETETYGNKLYKVINSTVIL